MADLYRIKDWDRCFESNQERKRVKGKLAWVRITTESGLAYKRLMRRPDGAALYGCWVALVRVAATQHARGVLAREDGTPLDADDLEVLTDIPAAEMAKAMEVLSSADIGWLVRAECADGAQEVRGQCADLRGICALEERRREEKRGEGDASDDAPTPPPSVDEVAKANQSKVRKTLIRWGLPATAETVAEWAAALQGRGQTPRVDGIVAGIAWISSQAARRAIPVQYAKDATRHGLIDEWATRQRKDTA